MLGVAVGVGERVVLGVPETEDEGEGVAAPEPDCVAAADGLLLALAPRERAAVGDAVAVAQRLTVDEGVSAALRDGVPVPVGLLVALGVCAALGV